MSQTFPSLGFPKTSETGETADAANLAMDGKINSTGTVTLETGVGTTVLTHRLLSPNSVVHFDPVTAVAATELYGATMYVLTANRGSGAWTITHVNSATAARTFAYSILG